MKNKNFFQQFSFARSNYNSKAISTCCDKSDGLRVELLNETKTKTKLEQLSNTSYNIFHSQTLFQLKHITLHRKFLKI